MKRSGCAVAAIGTAAFIIAGIKMGSWLLVDFGIFFPAVVWLANDFS